MGRTVIAALAGAALLGAGLLAGSSLAGGGSDRPAAEPIVAKPIVGVAAAEAGNAGQPAVRNAAKKRRRPVIRYFYASEPTVPPEGESLVQPLQCPAGKGQPIAGGAQTAQGIDIVYLSRVHPGSGRRPPRTYYVGIEDVASDNPDAGAVVEIQCAMNVTVRR